MFKLKEFLKNEEIESLRQFKKKLQARKEAEEYRRLIESFKILRQTLLPEQIVKIVYWIEGRRRVSFFSLNYYKAKTFEEIKRDIFENYMKRIRPFEFQKK